MVRMSRTITIGLVGNYNSSALAHQAIPLALQNAAEFFETTICPEWIPTEEINSPDRVSHCDGLWCVPASPYRSLEGALLAIRHAREARIPFLGTCGGFQHAVLEYARNVLHWSDATHAEISPGAPRAVISPLSCGLVEVTGSIQFVPGTRIAAAYAALGATEGYHCRYGLNPELQSALTTGPLRVSATDGAGDVRAVELDDHPFFVATLFQPERAALRGDSAPLVVAFARACVN
jgi:CTP synthase (UTP-ammonia lyase)